MESGFVRHDARYLRVWGPNSPQPAAFHALCPLLSDTLMAFDTHEEAQAWLDDLMGETDAIANKPMPEGYQEDPDNPAIWVKVRD